MIHWTALAEVTVATLIATLVVVTSVSVGILALNKAGEPDSQIPRWLLRVGGYLCVSSAAAVVLFGIYLIVPQLH